MQGKAIANLNNSLQKHPLFVSRRPKVVTRSHVSAGILSYSAKDPNCSVSR
ncbi:hypothetical protein Mapa_001774 [Marchantia paleacea]|nr:hypothetical protein Mapa_001774 [Marchantia paleacea]